MPLRAARVGRVGVIGAPGGEDRGRGQGSYTWPVAGCEDRGRGGRRHTREGGPAPNLAPVVERRVA